jgi:hypothetical protein
MSDIGKRTRDFDRHGYSLSASEIGSERERSKPCPDLRPQVIIHLLGGTL